MSKSRPSGSPTATWSRASKASGCGLPSGPAAAGSQRRISTLSSADSPSGALACGRLGTDMSSSFSGCCSAASSSSSCFRRTGTAWDSAMTALASSPLALSWPICLASALRRACRDSVSVWTALRRDSRSLNRSVSKDTPRVLRRSTTVCRSLRSSIGSSMVMSVRLRRASGPAAPYRFLARSCASSSRRKASFCWILASSPRSVGR